MKVLKKIQNSVKGSIRGRLMLYFILLLMVPFMLFAVLAYQSEKDALSDRIKGHLTSIADIQKGRVRAWLAERQSDARFLARDEILAKNLSTLKQMNDPEIYKYTDVYREVLAGLEAMAQNHDYFEVMLLDEGGRVVVSTNPAHLGESRSGDDYYTGAMKNPVGVTHIQDIMLDPHLNQLTMAFSAPIKDYKDPARKGGVAAVVMGMDRGFYPIFAGWPGMGKTGDTLIVRREKGYIVFLNRLRFEPDAPLTLRYRVDDNAPSATLFASEGREGIIETDDYRGVKVLAAYRYIPETKWGFVVKEDYNDAFAPVHSLTFRFAIALAVTLVLVILLIYLFSKRMAEPIVSLSALARKIAGGDFSARLPVKRSDEVGSLAASFNEMASALMEYKNQVNEKNTELEKANTDLVMSAQSLEEKVRDRTQELEDLNRALYSMMEDLDERTEALEKSQVEMKKFAAELEEQRNRVRENLEIVEKANVELRRIDRMKDHFLGMMSHELRTPLSLITGYSSNILADYAGALDPHVAEGLEGIVKGSERLKTIVTEMLDLSQIDAKGLRLTFEPVNIGKVMEGVLQELALFVKERDHRVRLDDYNDLPEVMIDMKRMHQVLVNILGNAIKFTPDGGSIEISFRMYSADCRVVERPDIGEGGYLDVVVKDTGIGLESEELDRIFEKFYEVGEIDKHATSKYAFLGRGVGLGLPIARGIVEAHGGRLWAESAGFDPVKCPGSVFHIMLPARPEVMEKARMGVVAETAEALPAPAAAEEEGAREAVMAGPPAKAGSLGGGPGRRRRVLVIEDDPDILNLTTLILRHEFEIIPAGDGHEGLKVAHEERPDLILLDVYMEDMNGYEVCRILKSDEATRGIPVAMFTAGVQKWEVDKGFRSGADYYITKPFKPAELLEKIRELIRDTYETAGKETR